MKYRITDTHINLNLTTNGREVLRLLALARLISYRSDDITLQLVSLTQTKQKSHIALRICWRQRFVLPMMQVVALLQQVVKIPGARLENISLTLIP